MWWYDSDMKVHLSDLSNIPGWYTFLPKNLGWSLDETDVVREIEDALITKCK